MVLARTPGLGLVIQRCNAHGVASLFFMWLR